MSDPEQKSQRRGVLAGAGVLGVLAVAASLLPGGRQAVADAKVSKAEPAPDTAAGYRLSEHVKSYYSSTRI